MRTGDAFVEVTVTAVDGVHDGVLEARGVMELEVDLAEFAVFTGGYAGANGGDVAVEDECESRGRLVQITSIVGEDDSVCTHVVRSEERNCPTVPCGHPVPDVVIPWMVTVLGSGLSARVSMMGFAMAAIAKARMVRVLMNILKNCQSGQDDGRVGGGTEDA